MSPKKYHGAKPAAVIPPSASNHQKTRYIFRGSHQPTSFLFLRGSEHRKHFEGLFLVCSSIAHILVYLCIFIFKSMFHLLTSQYFNNLDLFLLPIIAIICDLTILIVFPCFSRRIIWSKIAQPCLPTSEPRRKRSLVRLVQSPVDFQLYFRISIRWIWHSEDSILKQHLLLH